MKILSILKKMCLESLKKFSVRPELFEKMCILTINNLRTTELGKYTWTALQKLHFAVGIRLSKLFSIRRTTKRRVVENIVIIARKNFIRYVDMTAYAAFSRY